ncbi:MAG: hypothetical protein VYC39_03100 [Myxococcota bacterium]|nr:hypothetical protein [Myxococcota bacterium]
MAVPGEHSSSYAVHEDHNEPTVWEQIYLQLDFVSNRRIFESNLSQSFSAFISLVWRPSFETRIDTLARFPNAINVRSDFGVQGIQLEPFVNFRKADLLEARE